MNYIEENRMAYDKLADEFRKKINLRAEKTRELVDVFSRLVGNTFNSPKVLDLGPGSGYEAKLMIERGCNVTCIELSPKMAMVVHDTAPEANIIVDEFLSHDFAEETFTAIYAVAFVHLFPHKDAIDVIAKIYGLLDKNGIAFISTTENRKSSEEFSSKTNFVKPVKRYRKRFTRKELEEIFSKIGFTVLYKYDDMDVEEAEKVWMNYVLRK